MLKISSNNSLDQFKFELNLRNQIHKTPKMRPFPERSKESRRKMDGDRYRLQRKLEICEQNLSVDYELLRQIRATYPQEIQLSGFLVGELPKPIVK